MKQIIHRINVMLHLFEPGYFEDIGGNKKEALYPKGWESWSKEECFWQALLRFWEWRFLDAYLLVLFGILSCVAIYWKH